MLRLESTSCGLLLSLCLLTLGAHTSAAHGETDDLAPPGRLWLTRPGGAFALTEAGAPGPATAEGPRQVLAAAFDPQRRTLWLSGPGALEAFDPNGERLLALPVPEERGDGGARLVVLAEDGSVWLSHGRRLVAFGPAGEPLGVERLGEEARALAVDPARRLLWVAGPASLESRDALSGALLERLETGLGVRDLALDPETGGLWLAVGDRLRRYDPRGAVEVDLPAAGLTALAADGAGGAWVARGAELVRYDRGGEAVTALLPFGEEAVLERLAFHPGHRALWASDGRSLVKLGASGWELQRFSLAEDVRLDRLLPASPVDRTPPRLALAGRPAPGGDLRVTLRYEDLESGVRPGSLAFSAGGLDVAADCTYAPRRADCRLDLPQALRGSTLLVTVADQLGNVSAPVEVRLADDSTARPEEETGERRGPRPKADSVEGGDPSAIYVPIDPLRGRVPDKPFMGGDGIDLINTSNGNLVLTIPLGPSYQVGSSLSYQLRLTYNSNFWDHADLNCLPPYPSDTGPCANVDDPPASFALPSRNSNAGVGWEFHFGKLFQPEPPGSDYALWTWPNKPGPEEHDRWLYVAPDGATHYLYPLFDRPAGAHYSTDGSHLRMRQVGGGERHVEHPDGRVSVFLSTSERAGTEYCGGAVGPCWRFAEMRDPYGNWVRVSYEENVAAETETWWIYDSVGCNATNPPAAIPPPDGCRRHEVLFDRSHAATVGGDGVLNLATSDGSEWGDLSRVLTSVTVAAFGDRQATYGFDYQEATLDRGKEEPHDINAFGPWEPVNVNLIRVPLLTGITVPESQPWSFAYEIGTNGNGRIREVTTPARGRLAYTWRSWWFPTRCDYHADATVIPEDRMARLGVGSKKRLAADAADGPTWVYSPRLHYTIESPPGSPGSTARFSGPDCERPSVVRTEVDGPVVDGTYTRRVFYHAVTEGPMNPAPTDPIGEWQVTDHGLPFTKKVRIGSGPGDYRFLSRETFECRDGGGCDKLRSTFVRYAVEYAPCLKRFSTTALGCYQRSPLRVAERTLFHDDLDAAGQPRWVETTSSDYDGAGHFGLERTTDNFAGPLRAVETETVYSVTGQALAPAAATGYYDVGDPAAYLPAAGAPWILHPFDKVTRREGGREYVTEYEFNPQGTQVCERRWKEESGRSRYDLVRQASTLGSTVGVDAGRTKVEVLAGGDTANLGTGNLCAANGSASLGSRFEIQHTYQFQQLASTRIGTFPYSFRATIDENTGLPLSLFDVADQETVYDYDLLGRVTEVDQPNGGATIEIEYDNPADGPPSVETRSKDGDTVLARQKTVYDDFARPVREEVDRPDGSGGVATSARVTVYNAEGRQRRVTTLQNDGSVDLAKSTRFFDYDPFGRPGRIVRPDGTVERRSYEGDRQTESTVEVRVSVAGTLPVTDRTIRDPRGRTVRFRNPIHTTIFTHDPDGNVVSAKRCDTTAPTLCQERRYDFDGRGFLRRDRHPEVGGASGNGWITYTRDAFGKPRTVHDGEHTLTHGYDLAGRPVAVYEGGRIWQEWEYGTSNLPTDLRKGKLVRSARHNYPRGGTVGDWAIEETYRYGGVLGLLSRRTLQQQFPDNTGADRHAWLFEFTRGYDALGRLTQLDYPECLTTPQNGRLYCNDPAEQPAPPQTVTTIHESGLPVSVEGSSGVGATFTYHPNLQLEAVAYSNGVPGQLSQGTNGMSRPARIQYGLFAPLFDTGSYEYDGAGNVWAIGQDRYTYDRANRLKHGTVKQAGPDVWERYRYDAMDNLVGRRKPGEEWLDLPVDERTNRPPGGVGDITWDGAGNLLTVARLADSSIRFRLSWDAFNMNDGFVERLEGGGEIEHLYLYGPGEYRVVEYQLEEGEETRFVTLRDVDGKILRTYRVHGWGHYGGPSEPGDSWRFQRDYVHGPNGLLASEACDGSQLFYHPDHLGSPRLLTDGDGNVVGERHYYPFGASAPSTGVDDRFAGFTGHERDLNGYTDYMLGRTYAFPLYQFLSIDPARDGWNLYAYVGNNPIGFSDPTGLSMSSEVKRQALEHAQLASCIYDENCMGVGDNSRLTTFTTPNDDGFKAALFYNATTSAYTLAFAGTDDIQDGIQDVAQGAGLVTSQYQKAAAAAQSSALIAQSREGRVAVDLTFVGHSLGGGLAAMASMTTGFPAVTFNAAGLHRGATSAILGFPVDFSGHRRRITAYSLHGDPLTAAQERTPVPMPRALGQRFDLHGLAVDGELARHSISNICRWFDGQC